MAWKFCSERIVLAREARGITQAELARMLGISPQQLSQWEKGHTIPGQESLVSICNVLECPPKFFYVQNGDNNPHGADEKVA